LEEEKMAPTNGFIGYYDDGTACYREPVKKSDYEIALEDLNEEFPNIDISPILLEVSFTPKNTMADAFQNIRYEFLLFLRELFR
jgi:hypothetical protein